MGARVWGLVLLMFLGKAAAREGADGAAGDAGLCARDSLVESLLPPLDSCSASGFSGYGAGSVIEGDEGALHKAVYLVHKNRGDYAALLFYASWCPFSKTCRPSFNMLQLLFPKIRHFAFEESAIKPSTLSSDVTGNKPISVDLASLDKAAQSPCNMESKEGIDLENCPFSWARSPEKLLQQDTYLALATAFVIIRLLYFLSPKLLACVDRAWRRHIRYASLMSLSQTCFEQGKLALTVLNPYKPKNLHEGARNARAWASQSLASVSIGEPSSTRVQAGRETR